MTQIIDPIKQIEAIFDNSLRTVLRDATLIQDLVNCLDNRRKFKVTINGFGGNVANVNIQIKTGKRTWIHASKNYPNRMVTE